MTCVWFPTSWTMHGARTPANARNSTACRALCTGEQFLGFLPVFDVIKDARGESGMPASVAADGSSGLQAPAVISESGAEIDQAPWDGPIAAQLVHSRDGYNWHRFEDRSPHNRARRTGQL